MVSGRNLRSLFIHILMLLDQPHRTTPYCCPFLPKTNIHLKLSTNLYLSFPLTIGLLLRYLRTNVMRASTLLSTLINTLLTCPSPNHPGLYQQCPLTYYLTNMRSVPRLQHSTASLTNLSLSSSSLAHGQVLWVNTHQWTHWSQVWFVSGQSPGPMG